MENSCTNTRNGYTGATFSFGIRQRCPYTYRYTTTYRANFCENETKKKEIVLNQDPSEHILIQMDIQKTNYYDSDMTFEITLIFNNNLHKMSSDFGYEVIIEKCQINPQNSLDHKLISSSKTMRINSEIKFSCSTTYKNQSSDYKLHHICIDIQRYTITQQKLKNVTDDSMAILLKEGQYSDASIVVGDKIFSVHKCILSCKSKVFKAMFTSDMTEGQTGIIKIDDFDVDVVESLLYFIYTDKIKNLDKLALELIRIAHKYEINYLIPKCEDFILFNVNRESLIDVLNFTSVYNLPNLRKAAMKFVEVEEESIMREKNFQDFLCNDLKVSTLPKILQWCDKYSLNDVKMKAFEFVKKHHEVALDNEFLNLFLSHPPMMREMFKFVYKNTN